MSKSISKPQNVHYVIAFFPPQNLKEMKATPLHYYRIELHMTNMTNPRDTIISLELTLTQQDI